MPQLLNSLRCRHIVADRGDDVDALLELIHAAGAETKIPSSSQCLAQRSANRRICRLHNLVERSFNELKHIRRIVARFDKSPETSSPP